MHLNRLSRRVTLFFMAVLFLMTGCGPITPTAPKGPVPPPDTVIDYYAQRQAQIQKFAGQGRIYFKDDRLQYNGESYVLAITPDSLKIRANDPMGRPVLTLSASGGNLSVLDHTKERLFQGAASRDNISRFMVIDFEIPDLITLLSGGQPLTSDGKATMEKVRESGQTLLLLTNITPNMVQKIWLSPNGKEVRKASYEKTGKPGIINIEYTKYKDINGILMPHRIQVRQGKSELTVEYSEVNFNNPKVTPELIPIKTQKTIRPEPIPGTRAAGP